MDKTTRTELLSCAISGTITTLIFQPIDALRTKLFFADKRLLIQNISPKSLYNGILFAIPAQITKLCATFPIQTMIHDQLNKTQLTELQKNISSGMIAGLTLAMVSTPINAIKIPLMQNSDNKFMDVTKTVYDKYGLKGFYRGGMATMCRDIIWNTLYFPIFNAINEKYKNRFFASSIAGCCALVIAYPFDGIRMYRQNNKANYNFWYGFKYAFNTSPENIKSFILCFFRVPLAIAIGHYLYLFSNDSLKNK